MSLFSSRLRLPGVARPGRAAGADTRAREGRLPIAEVVAKVPQALRAQVRADEIWLVVLAAFVGASAGLIVVGMHETALAMQRVLFRLDPGEDISAMASISWWRALLVPTTGGVILGMAAWALARWLPRRTVDPIEANALYGGRMSLVDSVIVMGQTVWSNGVGASVGLEAGYAQIGSAIASWLGASTMANRSSEPNEK